MLNYKKEYGVYHWDTFDNKTILMYESNHLVDCKDFIVKHYDIRLRDSGADRIDIVDKQGNIIRKFNVG